jgi:microcystin-dependent protein
MSFDDPLWIQSDGTSPVYSAREDRFLISAMWSEGVITGLRAKQRVAGAQMKVQLEDGTCVIKGDDSASPDQNHYLGRWTDDAVDANMWTIAAAPGSNSRRDLLYIRINDPAHGGPAGRNFTLGIVQGTASASPALGALPTSAIPIAEVLVATGTTSITNAMITDLRLPALMTGANPAGVIQPFAGAEASVPAGWLLCNGQAVNRLTYFGLFRLLGTTYGAGDGSTTFNLPDLRGRTPFGLDNMGGSDAGRLDVANTLGGSGGEQKHTMTLAEMVQHAHDLSHDHPAVNGAGAFFYLGGPDIWRIGSGTPSGTTSPASIGNDTVNLPNFTGNTGNQGSSTPFNVMPPYVLVNYLIKT